MKLNFRDLKQQKFTIDAEPSETVGQIKEKIAAEKGWETSLQKLIYSGKILADANTVESYNIEEKGFIVCMVSKPKVAPAPKAAPPSTPAAPISTPAQPPAPQQPSTTTTTQPNPPATPTPAPASTTTSEGQGNWNDPSALLVGQRSQQAIAEMEAMGFQRAEIDRAMRAAFFNPNRAIEYLLTGIPANVQAEQRQSEAAATTRSEPQGQAQTLAQPAAQPAAAAQQPLETEDDMVNLFEAAAQQGQQGTGARSGGGQQRGAGGQQGQQLNIDFLRNSPHFQHLRQLVQQQPAMLEPILQQVAEGNPQLAQMIGQNQEQFLQLLSEEIGGEGGGGSGMGEGGPLPPGAQQISVTEEERDAIERLIRLGFARDAVIQAYFACDKNEELAANFLFEQPDEEDDQ